MGITFKSERYFFSLYVYEIEFIPDIEKEFNKLKDNYQKVSDFAVKEGADLGGFVDGLGGITEQFLKLVAYKDSADVGTSYKEAIHFPLPNSLDETYDQNFQADNMNILYDAYNYTIDKIGFGSVSKHLQDTLLRGNAIVDKNLLMIYSGSKPRTITASWNFVPRSQEEFDLLKTNIMTLYNYSSAIREKVKFFNSEIPINYLNQNNIFKIKILDGENETRMSKLLGGTLGDGFFISNITTNINLLNSPFRYDGSPSNFSLTINFTERKPLWFEHWQKQIDESKEQ